MYISSNDYKTYLGTEDIQKITKITRYLIDQVDPPQLGLYSEMSQNDLWIRIVAQFCVIGGADKLEELEKNRQRYDEFRERLSLKVLWSKRSGRREYISNMLKYYKATSFYNKQAEKIGALLDNPRVVKDGRLVLFSDMDHRKLNFQEIRKMLINRNPYLKLKSASELMIDTGLSIDVIALNSRIAGILADHFGLEADHHKLQNTRYLYESVEDGLRRGCNRLGIPLAYLHRMLFRFSGKDTISFILENL